MPKILDRINKANDIKNIDPKDYKRLASEIRQFIINNVSNRKQNINIGGVVCNKNTSNN